MKTATMFILLSVFNASIIFAQPSTSEFKWIDGYLEKDYKEAVAVHEADGIPGMFDKCVAVRQQSWKIRAGTLEPTALETSRVSGETGVVSEPSRISTFQMAV